MASKNVLALAQRIKDEFGIVVDPDSFRRTYAGRNQRAAGAITWEIRYGKNNLGSIGGYEPIRKYTVQQNQLVLNDSTWALDKELYVIAPGEPGYIPGDKPPTERNLLGQHFGFWEVIGPFRQGKDRHREWLCRCMKCGTERYVSSSALRKGGSTSCGCDRAEKAQAVYEVKFQAKAAENTDLIGLKVGVLEVIGPMSRDTSKQKTWKCRCLACGSEKYIREFRLKNNLVQSCGCQKNKNRRGKPRNGGRK